MFISVLRKGRNAGWALKDILGADNYFNPDYIASFLNGRAKTESKKESWNQEFKEEFNSQGWQEIARKTDTGRKSQRAVLDEIKVPAKGRKLIVSGGSPEKELFQPTRKNEVYVADDQAANRLLQKENIEYTPQSQELDSFLQQNVEGYIPVDEVGEDVSLSVMWSKTTSTEDIDTILLPSDLYSLSEQIAESYWRQDIEKVSYRDYADSGNFSENWDEEELISDSSEEVAGIYITDSGRTAREYGLEYDEVVDSTVRKWSKKQNDFAGEST